MKLRVRINKVREVRLLELQGDDPTLTELNVQIKETILPSCRLSPDLEFTLSLYGNERLLDNGQTLSSFGIVSGDMICVDVPESDGSEESPGRLDMPLSDGSEESTVSLPPTNQSVDEQPSTSSGVAVAHRYTWEPMLCSEAEEGKIPYSLEVLHHGAQSRSPCDSLMVAIHLLMVETGFIPQGVDGVEIRPGEMPSGWRAMGGLYKLQYTHPFCQNSPTMILAVSMGSILVINATVKINETVSTARKLSVTPSSYVTNEVAGESAAAVFKDLDKLSRIFKDQLAYPLIAATREAMALPAAFGLCALPPELLLRILRLLDVHSLLLVASVNKHLHSTAADSLLWRHLCIRDFNVNESSRSPDTDWKKLYRTTYRSRRHYRSVRSHPSSCFRFPGQPVGVPYPAPLYIPGIIGGEYDQRPQLPVLPHPRRDPIGPFPGRDPTARPFHIRRGWRTSGSHSEDVRHGFI